MLQRCKLPQVFIMSYRPDIISDYGIIKQKTVLLAVRRGLELPCLNITASFLTKELVRSLGPSLYFTGLGWNGISLAPQDSFCAGAEAK